MLTSLAALCLQAKIDPVPFEALLILTRNAKVDVDRLVHAKELEPGEQQLSQFMDTCSGRRQTVLLVNFTSSLESEKNDSQHNINFYCRTYRAYKTFKTADGGSGSISRSDGASSGKRQVNAPGYGATFTIIESENPLEASSNLGHSNFESMLDKRVYEEFKNCAVFIQ